ncbi:FRG domain-containing protein [Aurantimonas sp. C2-6-R+9]|uniref:FRG domain-containing protein n=1 Tax=unclassified Aurantimonas TaxID=2638230 RepID=UPI002E180552|nr:MULTISPECIES: FRG domain-containing protein [unclassified Aurantimonas]MEC5292523.1 FRG domain-containing protein [Aurantimonas sp. C2-3-R2]MEC5381114.1 FRG domain-containing protein [Aurantimonas sp. C2-6-R+9]MEC5413555.1 FRG domain-containing protein [Aurantimonas sp. C2-4-R8]
MPLDEGISIGSLSTLLKLLKDDPPPKTHVDLYRGHSKREYRIHPSLFRKGAPRKDESNLLRELISAHPSEFSSDKSTFERLVRMQHYKMPTRLLDLSFNPLVAMYFACCSNCDLVGHLIRIRVPKTSIKYYDSDTVSGRQRSF